MADFTILVLSGAYATSVAATLDILPEGLAIYDTHDRLVLCNARYREIAPGVTMVLDYGTPFEDVLRRIAGSGEIMDAQQDTEAWLAARLARHRSPSGDAVQEVRGDRWMRLTERPLAGGGVVVLRGLPNNSAKALTAALSKVARPGEQLTGVGIDPRLFRAFGVVAVPTYDVTGSDFDLCDGFDCVTAVPPHDRMTGNVSAAYALETFARGGGPGALLAAQHLARLERPKP